MRRQDLARLLLRLNIVRSLDEHIIDEVGQFERIPGRERIPICSDILLNSRCDSPKVWHYLDEDESGSVSIEVYSRKSKFPLSRLRL
jgi:hypothetical protein